MHWSNITYIISNVKLDFKAYDNHLFDSDACQPPHAPVKALTMHFQMPLVNDKVSFWVDTTLHSYIIICETVKRHLKQ